MDYLPEGTSLDLRNHGLREAAIAILTSAAQMERRTWGPGDEPWTGSPEPVDFPAWLSDVLTEVSRNLGGTEALLAGRPGSWEADLVRRLCLDG